MNLDEWWQIRMYLKPKVYHAASPMTLKQWANLKHDFKRKLKKNGFEQTMQEAIRFVEYHRSRYQ
jgi:hypothetical protein